MNATQTYQHLGYSNLASSILWLDFIQFYGSNIIRTPDEVLRRRYHEISYEYLNRITALDPRFVQPYLATLNAVGWKQGRPDLARLLMIRGTQYFGSFREEDIIFIPYVWLNLSLVYLLFYANGASIEFTYDQAAFWVESLSPKQQELYGANADAYRATGKHLASQVSRDPIYAQFVGWRQVFLGADDPEVQDIARKELEAMGAEVSLNEEGRYSVNPPPPEEGTSRIQLRF
ncbi:MAG: hypothetical protein OHK0012_23290 [Synechococcales cyanobacterium]